MGREAGCHSQLNTGAHAAPSRGRPVLSIADNPEVVGLVEPAPLGEDKVPSPGHDPFLTSSTPTYLVAGTKTVVPRVDTAPNLRTDC